MYKNQQQKWNCKQKNKTCSGDKYFVHRFKIPTRNTYQKENDYTLVNLNINSEGAIFQHINMPQYIYN